MISSKACMESWIKATEARQQNKILTALLEQIQSLLPQVEDQGKRTALEAGLAQLGKRS